MDLSSGGKCLVRYTKLLASLLVFFLKHCYKKECMVPRTNGSYRASPRETKSARRYPFSPPNSRFQYVFEAVGNKE